MRRQSASVAILSGVLGMASAATVYAGSSPQSDDHARSSLATALNERALPVLVRRSPRAPDATLSSLITSVTRADRTLPVEQQSREFERGRVLVTGKDWKLMVFRDGSAAEFINQAAASRAHDLKVDGSKAMTLEQLEFAGRAFITRVYPIRCC